MDEKELLDDAQETVQDEAVQEEGIVNDAGSPSQDTEAAAEAEVSAETETEENAEGAPEDEAEDSDKEDADEVREEGDFGGSGDFTPKASGKTTAVLFAIIAVLVILIIVFAVIIAGKLKNEKDNDEDDVIPTSAVSAVKVTSDEDEDLDGDEDEDAAEVRKEYNVSVELGNYKGLEVDFPEVEVTSEDINDELSDFLEEHSEIREVSDRPSQNGDTLNISYVGYMDGEEFDGGTDSDVEFVLGSGQFFDAFEEGLVGVEVGEHTLDLTFPEDYYEDMAGKPVTFVVTVNSIGEKWTPALTDDLVKENTEYETVNEYRAYIEGYLTEEALEEAEEQANAEIIRKALDNTVFSGDIDEEIEDMTAEYMDYYDSMAQSYYGVDGATLFGYFYGMSEEEYKDYLKNESAYALKLQYMLDKIAETEGLTYTQEEYDAEFEEIFISYYGFADREEAEGQYTTEEIDETVSKSLLRDKAQNLIIDSAVINK